MDSFVHLHVHSHFSVLDGMSNISGLIDKASKNGMNSIALTDHGNMFGVKEFFNYAKKKNGKVHSQIKDLKKELNAEGISEEQRIALLAEIEKTSQKPMWLEMVTNLKKVLKIEVVITW